MFRSAIQFFSFLFFGSLLFRLYNDCGNRSKALNIEKKNCLDLLQILRKLFTNTIETYVFRRERETTMYNNEKSKEKSPRNVCQTHNKYKYFQFNSTGNRRSLVCSTNFLFVCNFSFSSVICSFSLRCSLAAPIVRE